MLEVRVGGDGPVRPLAEFSTGPRGSNGCEGKLLRLGEAHNACNAGIQPKKYCQQRKEGGDEAPGWLRQEKNDDNEVDSAGR